MIAKLSTYGAARLASVLCVFGFVPLGRSQDKNESQQIIAAALLQAVAVESENAVSEFIPSFPNAIQLHRAAKAVSNDFHDQEAVAFFKEVAHLSGDRRSLGDAAELTAFLALAVLAEKHETASFLKSMVSEKSGQRSENAFAAISFLPASLARSPAEDIVADLSQNFETRIKFLFLLRAIGDRGTLDKLAELAPEASPHVRDVQNRSAEFIKLRLDRGTRAEQERWSRQELTFIQATCYSPGFRSGRVGLAWGAEQIHQTEPDIAVALLEARLKLERPMSFRYDYNVLHEIAPTAAIVGIQKNTQVLPLLDAWAETDFGFVSSICRETASELRSAKK
jgi:hypothetical protein